MNEIVTYGEALRRQRRKQGLKQKDIAKKVGVSQSYLSSVERDETNLTYDKMVEIAGALDCDVSFHLMPEDVK